MLAWPKFNPDRPRSGDPRWGWVMVVLMILTYRVEACGVCGCGAGGSPPPSSLVPLYERQLAGVRMRHQVIRSAPGAGPYDALFAWRSQVTVYEAWARIELADRWQMLAILPWQQGHYRPARTDEPHRQIAGLGDGSVLGLYRLTANPPPVPDDVDGPLPARHEVWVGLGLKAPTGLTDQQPLSTGLSSLSPGTGSWDPLLTARYGWLGARMGLLVEGIVRLPGASPGGVRLGHRHSAQVLAFRLWRPGAWTIAPHAGLIGEQARRDRIRSLTLRESGGYGLAGAIGGDVTRTRWSVSAQVQLPLVQHLAAGSQVAGPRYSVGVACRIGRQGA